MEELCQGLDCVIEKNTERFTLRFTLWKTKSCIKWNTFS
jgi:hypothetical protein